MQRTPDGGTGRVGQVTFESTPLPLALAGAVAQRYLPELQLGGHLTGKGRVQWSGPQLVVQSEGLHAESFALANPAWLGTEILRLAELDVRGEMSQENGVWAGRGVQLQCDVATLEFSGQGALPGTQATAAGDWSQSLLQSTCDLKAEADLARLAALLPATLRVREGTRIASGRVSVGLSGAPQAEGHGWDGTVLIHNLAAEHQGRKITWDQPVEVRATALEPRQRVGCEAVNLPLEFFEPDRQGQCSGGNAANGW